MEVKPGEPTVTLSRKYQDDDIKVIVHMPAFHSSTVEESSDELEDRHKDGNSDPRSSIRLVLSSTNCLGTTLEYGVIAYPDDFSIVSFSVKYLNDPVENIYYKGSDYAQLDNNLQKEFKRRLKIRGIVPSTTKFLHEYMANRDMHISEYSSNSPPTPSTDRSIPESIDKTFESGYMINDEGIPVHHETEEHRQRGHPLVSADDIRSRGKNRKDFIYIPYPYTLSEKLLWIEVPAKGFFASSESDSDWEDETDDDYIPEHKLFVDEDNPNPYRCLPPKNVGDPIVFSEEMDKILYPDLIHMNDMKVFWENARILLKAHHDEMEKIEYPNGREVIEFESDLDREWYQVHCMEY